MNMLVCYLKIHDTLQYPTQNLACTQIHNQRSVTYTTKNASFNKVRKNHAELSFTEAAGHWSSLPLKQDKDTGLCLLFCQLPPPHQNFTPCRPRFLTHPYLQLKSSWDQNLLISAVFEVNCISLVHHSYPVQYLSFSAGNFTSIVCLLKVFNAYKNCWCKLPHGGFKIPFLLQA
jgi:hypothetical protein